MTRIIRPVPRYETCPECLGAKLSRFQGHCLRCAGRGVVPIESYDAYYAPKPAPDPALDLEPIIENEHGADAGPFAAS